MAQILRPYQVAAQDAIFEAFWAGSTRILWTQATGTGKTTTMASVVDMLLSDPMTEHRVLILSHRREIIQQTVGRIASQCRLDDYEIGTELAKEHAPETARVIVGSIQTCSKEHRLKDIGWTPTVIFIDECHRSQSVTYRRICDRFGVTEGKCILIGCTATPYRTDKQVLYAVAPDGSPMMVEEGGATRKAQRVAGGTSGHGKHSIGKQG